ncbi:MAG: prepilin-type N-terminal cleavage/methylation domain-containing protein [Candidatus Rifleibacteriota bacterium]
MTGRINRKGFSLIELMVVLLVISTIMIFAVEEYIRHIEDAKIARAKADLDELVKSVRLYNIREGRNFRVATFTIGDLGNFVGTYLEKEPSKDPWGNFYQHSPDLGVVFSPGPNGKADILSETATGTIDDIVVRYLPEGFFITHADYVDANLNNLIDFGDHIELRFSRPARLVNPVFNDFITEKPERALGSAMVSTTEDSSVAKIVFMPPEPPLIRLGETTINPREFIDSVVDFSPVPRKLERLNGVIINKKKK